MRSPALAASLAVAVSGCAYYNAMWTAERFAKEARRLEARGQVSEAQTQWARAAVKAESVLARHPRSRWADDALVLRGEGLARAGDCTLAAAPIAKALATVSDASLRERSGLAAAQCALAGGKPVDAEQALAQPLASADGGRRSRAEYLAGQASVARRDYDAAVAHFRRSREPAALPARAHALLAAGRPADAAAVIDTIARGTFAETEGTELLGALAAVGGADAASAALDRMLGAKGRGTRVPFAERARLLIADGDRLLALADYDAAAARYRQAQLAAPAANEAGLARVRELRVLAARAVERRDLVPIVAELTRMSRPSAGDMGGGGGGSGRAGGWARGGGGGGGGGGGTGGAAEARSLLDLVTHVASTPETPGLAFRAAELARDSLRAPHLAGALFLSLAAADSGSLFAPKALVAALALLPDRRDSIAAVLESGYAASPYAQALRGEATPAYTAAEDSLARELGVQVARATPSAAGEAGARFGVPLTGPRGPVLEEPPAARPARVRPQTPPPPPPRPDRP